MSPGPTAKRGTPRASWTETARGRRVLFAGLYFAEGAPIGFVWWALPVWLRTSGVEPGEIARIMAWVAWPWALKFLWAPLVDVLRGPRFGLRGWILASETAMALSLVPLLFLDIGLDSRMVLAVLMVHAVAAATQDAAIDTLAIKSVPAAERGAINGWMQVGMLGARALFGGGAILLAAHIGERAVVALLIAAVAAPMALAAVGAREAPAPQLSRRERLATYRAGLASMLRRRALWVGLVFASTAGAGFEGLASLAGPLLLDRGAPSDVVGFLFLVPTVVLMALGALAGGRASDRFGRRRTTFAGEALAAVTVIAIGCAAWWLPASAGYAPFAILLGLLYFAAGVATAALYSLFMQLSDRAVAATQFCVFMAGINFCYVWSTRLLGFLVERSGYGPAIVCIGVVSLLALPLLLAIREDA